MNALEAGLYGALTGGTALTALLAGTASVYSHQAPENADVPYVVFNWMDEAPRWMLPELGMEDFRYMVKGVTKGTSMKAAGEIHDAIDNVLSDGVINVNGYTSRYIRRVGGVSYTETVEGLRYNHRGGIYRIMLEPE